MKKNMYFILICFVSYSMAYAQYTAIPDSNFEQELINDGIDSEGILDNRILTSDANSFTGTLNVVNKGISDLTGIESFTSISGLDFGYNTGINNVDLTSCTSLLTVDGTGCSNLSSINVTGLVNITKLKFTFCNLQYLDVTTNIALKDLNVRGNQIPSLDLTQNVVIDHVDVKTNPLVFADLRNGNCANMVFYVGDYTPCLKCLFVDDSSDPHLWDHAYWIFDDITQPVSDEAECATWPEIPESYCSSLGLEELNKVAFNMYPNPVNEVLHVAVNTSHAVINICSITGKVVLTKNLNQTDNLIDVSGLASGIYLARFESDQRVDTKKLVIR
ncbi:T9SS type A sorting domain-containing protein [Xanthomarina sp. F1114]|uniref:T9SS type A sorting domain-containing protein n=1 Tax=Xanthomarina sp. F1114 TaxID=2996019 RepID=UPI00225E469C|nr:T9SS type A sorting domain-containing protein [Xanthomarina sp. F1114]MCX7547011.1 T9SS type A sorting domain-containing protein [Xanthomarina sp. F1114]